MGAIDFGAVMDGIAAALADIDDLRAYAWPDTTPLPPCAIVGYPDSGRYDHTKGRGADRATFPLFVVVGAAESRTARDRLGVFIDGTGAQSIKTAVDGTLGGACQSAAVQAWTILPQFTMGGAEYLAVRFDVDVVT